MADEKKIKLPEHIENNPNYIYGSQFKFDPVLADKIIDLLNHKKEK